MEKSKISAEEILALLDREAKEYNFPMPDNISSYNAGMRLTGFRSDEEWLLLFEMPGYTKIMSL